MSDCGCVDGSSRQAYLEIVKDGHLVAIGSCSVPMRDGFNIVIDRAIIQKQGFTLKPQTCMEWLKKQIVVITSECNRQSGSCSASWSTRLVECQSESIIGGAYNLCGLKFVIGGLYP